MRAARCATSPPAREVPHVRRRIALGRITRTENGFEAQRRVFAHPAAAVWAMLTEPAQMAQWLAPGRIEPERGEAVRIDFADSGIVIDSRVTAFIPGRLLEYS